MSGSQRCPCSACMPAQGCLPSTPSGLPASSRQIPQAACTLQAQETGPSFSLLQLHGLGYSFSDNLKGCTSWLEESGGWPFSSPSEPTDLRPCMLLRMPLIPEALLAGESLSLSEVSFSDPAMEALPAPSSQPRVQSLLAS